MRDVAITGVGLVSALGCERRAFFDRLVTDQSAIRSVADPREGATDRFWCAPVTDFPLPDWMTPKLRDGSDVFAQWAMIAARQALDDAGLDCRALPATRTAVVHGTSMGGMRSLMRAQFDLERSGPGAIERKTMMKMWGNMAAAQICMQYGLHGPSLTVATACASTIDALGTAARFIESGQADIAIVGGTEAGTFLDPDSLHDGFVPAMFYAPVLFGMLSRVDDPRAACLPFDANRGGIVGGEGSAFFVLERGEHARARGARPWGYLAGYASLADAYHPSAPDPSGQWEARAMALAVEDAGIPATEVDALLAHGTGTPKGDLAEIRAINAVHGARSRPLPVASIKAHLGHSAASSAGMSLIAGLAGMQARTFVHTANSRTPDPEIDFDLVLGQPRALEVAVLQVNAFGFGGQNASMVIRAAPQARGDA